MDKRAFKQRMQNLKSYRENNPGKGYIEFMEDLAKFKAKEWGENEDIILTEMLNDNTYNYKQMYEDNPNYNIQEGHFQDTYKTVYHPTFSKESMYSGKKSQYNPEGITGGWWDYNNKIFHAGYKQDIRNTQKYLNQEDPGWKVKAFQDGGEIGNEERQYLHSWYTNRREYAKRHMPAMLKQLDDADIYIDPNSRIRNIYSTPITISNDKIKQASKDSGIGEYGGYYHPNEGVVLPSDYKQWKDREPLLHELNHVVNIFNSSIFDQVNKVLEGKQIIDRGQEVNNYLTTPSEVQSRLIEFRKLNNLDPTKVYGIPDVREWRRTGKDADLLNTFDDDTVLELINTVAHTPNKKVQRAAEGGQTGDPEKERFYQATGRSSSGRPLEEGLKPVFSLEDAANMTPIGDAISAKDAYDAVKNRDWLGAGLAALTVLPFVPSGLRNVKAAARYIPTVNRTEQSLINQALGNISKKRDYLSDIANSRNRVLEDINTIPYRNRAEQADKIFGTNYSETYDLLDDLYQHRYFDLPEVQPKDMVASGRLQAKPFAEERFNKTGVGAEPNEFDLWVNTGMYRDPMQLANHEMNHYTDYIISRNANTTINNNMLKQLENSLKQTDATSYYRKGTEQKAYMNQLRTMLKQNGDVQNLDEPVSSTLLKKYLDKMSDSDPIKKMFKQHKNINAYTKWFNTIPLLGTTALGANAYFNNNKDE